MKQILLHYGIMTETLVTPQSALRTQGVEIFFASLVA